MKHIFIIHSPITYLSALSVIQKEKLSIDSVLILSQGYYIENAVIPLYIIKINIIENLFYPYKKLYKKIDQFIKNSTFILYTPLLMHISRFIIAHQMCVEFNFIEEGLSAYYDYFNIDQHIRLELETPIKITKSKLIKRRIKESIWGILGYGDKANAIPSSYESYQTNPNITFYGFHERAYSRSVNKINCNFNDLLSIFNTPSEYSLSNNYVWINDPDIYIIDGSIEEYLDGIKNGYINYLKSNKRNFSFIKFHQRDTLFLRTKIEELFIENNIQIEIISNQTILEIELLKSNNVTLVGIYSSLLFYGHIMGHKSYTICNFLKKNTNCLLIERQVSIFFNFVEKLHF